MKELVVKIEVPFDDNKSAETYVRNMWDKSDKKYVVASLLLTLVEKDGFKNLISSGCTEEEVETAMGHIKDVLKTSIVLHRNRRDIKLDVISDSTALGVDGGWQLSTDGLSRLCPKCGYEVTFNTHGKRLYFCPGCGANLIKINK